MYIRRGGTYSWLSHGILSLYLADVEHSTLKREGLKKSPFREKEIKKYPPYFSLAAEIKKWKEYPKKYGCRMPLWAALTLSNVLGIGKSELKKHVKFWGAQKGLRTVALTTEPLKLNKSFAYLFGLLLAGGYKKSGDKFFYSSREVIDPKDEYIQNILSDIPEWKNYKSRDLIDFYFLNKIKNNLNGCFGVLKYSEDFDYRIDPLSGHNLTIPNHFMRNILRLLKLKCGIDNPLSYFENKKQRVPEPILDSDDLEIKRVFCKAFLKIQKIYCVSLLLK